VTSSLVLKLLLAPALVVASSLAGRRWGPSMSGTLVAFPVVAGPILLITDLDHGHRFASRAAAGALLGLVGLALFAVVFVRAGRSRGWITAVSAGTIACIICDAALSGLHAAPGIGLVMAAAAFAGALALGVRDASAAGDATDPGRPGWDLPARALATMALVLAVTGASSTLGPHLTGILAPFPVATSVLAAFVLAQEGSPQATVLLRGFLRGAFGFATFCFLVAVLLPSLGTALSFTLAAAGALTVQIGFVAGLSRLNTSDYASSLGRDPA
jgi:hypothetical protein